MPSYARTVAVLAVLTACLRCGSSDSSGDPSSGGASTGGSSAGSGGKKPDGSSTGGSAALGGTGAAGSGGSGTGGQSTGGQSTGGQSTGGQAGSAGAPQDAAIDAESDSSLGGSGGSAGCVGFKWCTDLDGDKHGDPTNTQTACSDPTSDAGKWTTICDDCADNSALAFPGQGACSGVPYTKGAGVAYDFDCDGVDEPCSVSIGTATCNIDNCGHQGYLPNATSTKSSQNKYCGSTSYENCTLVIVSPGVLSCEQTFTTAQPFPCQ